MSKLTELRAIRKRTLTLRLGEGEGGFDVEIPLPTPYETQTIILDTTDANLKKDKLKASATMVKKAVAWIEFNLPKIEGDQLSLKDLNNTEYSKLVDTLLSIFQPTNTK